jgi:hypothetical protein
MILIRPDLAVAGTVVTNPAGLRSRSLAVSAARLPPDEVWTRRLNTTTMPRLVRLRPLNRRRPPGATVCGSFSQTPTGQQRTEVM